jgi:hypothetical protein
MTARRRTSRNALGLREVLDDSWKRDFASVPFVPHWTRILLALFGVAVALIWTGLAPLTGWTVVALYAAAGFAKLRRWIHRTVNARHAARRKRIQAEILIGRATAARAGLWFAEADGSISIGGKRITVDLPVLEYDTFEARMTDEGPDTAQRALESAQGLLFGSGWEILPDSLELVPVDPRDYDKGQDLFGFRWTVVRDTAPKGGDAAKYDEAFALYEQAARDSGGPK